MSAVRALITTPAGLGHVSPMVPLARAIQALGHDVRWATPSDTCQWVEDAGFTAVPAGMPLALRMPEFLRQFPQTADLPPEERPNVMFPGMFGAIAAPRALVDLVPLVEDWMPQLIVHDAAELAAPIVAAIAGVPNVTKGFGPLVPRHRAVAATDAVAPLWESVGLEPRPYAGCYDHLYLDVYPPSLHHADATHVGHRQLLRPVTYDIPGTAAVIPLPAVRTDRPLVYLTMGTVFNNIGPMRECIEALAGLDVRLLATLGPGADVRAFGEQLPHVMLADYVPQSLVLPLCDVVVSHAGSGTALGALALGLPQLCLPQGADQFLNATAVAASGAGLALLPDDTTGEAVDAAVSRLLAEPAFRDAAATVARTIAAMPTPDDVAAVLERLV